MISKNNDTTIHVKNIQKFMTEFYQYLYGLSAPITKWVFIKRILKYNLWKCRVTFLPNPKTKKYGTVTVAYKAGQICSTLQTRHKSLALLEFFKFKIKNWHCSDCRIVALYHLSNFCWWFRFYKLKLSCQEVYVSINIYPGCIQDLSGKCLLRDFASDKFSKFIPEEALRRLFFG